MNEDLRILIGLDANEGVSVGNLNRTIKKIEKHPSLRKIQLQIDIDKNLQAAVGRLTRSLGDLSKILNTISSANVNVNSRTEQATAGLKKQTQAIDQQNQALEKNRILKQKLTTTADGSVRIDTTTGDKYETETRSRTVITDKDTLQESFIDHPTVVKQIDYEKRRVDEQREYNKLIKQNLDDENKRYAEFENFHKQRYNAEQEYSNWWNKALIDRGKKEIQKEERVNQQRIKKSEDYVTWWEKSLLNQDLAQKKVELGRIHDEQKAWDAAYREKEKREAHIHGKRVQDTYRAYQIAEVEDQKFNNKRIKREQEFARQQQNTINKIENARLKYGHNRGVNQQLDSLLLDARQLKATDDFGNKLKDINTAVGTTTRGLKAAKQQSLEFGDALTTALVKLCHLVR